MRYLLLSILFLSCHCLQAQGVSGAWQGVLYQQDGGPATYYPYAVELMEQAGGLSGTTFAQVPHSDYFCRNELSGQRTDSLRFTTRILEQLPAPGFNWHAPMVTLGGSGDVLQGRWTVPGVASGRIELWRLRVLSPTTFCAGTPVHLSVSGTRVHWYADAACTQLLGIANEYQPALTSSATFYLKQEHYGTESPALPLHVEIIPRAVPQLPAEHYLCAGDTLRLAPGAFDSYRWQDGSTGSTFTVAAPGIYTVAVRNACGSGSATVNVWEGRCSPVFANAFTPNNDGRNDRFRALGAEGLERFELHIFDRWGALIFHTTDASAGWNGSFHGTPAPAGSYVWQCSWTRNGSARRRSGTVTLLR